MSINKEFSFVAIKSEPDDDSAFCFSKKVKVEDNPARDIVFHFDLQHTLKVNENEDPLSFKQEEIYVREEISTGDGMQNIDTTVFKCGLCNFKTAHKGNLRRHMRIHLNEKPFTPNLTEVKTHTGEESCACDSCNFKAALRNNLVRHMNGNLDLQHTLNENEDSFRIKPEAVYIKEEIPTDDDFEDIDTTVTEVFECDLCKYKSTQKDNLASHMIIHKEYKPYVCNECGFKTIKELDLKDHMRNHIGKKPFECGLCEFKTAGRSDLINHIRIHMKPFACRLCKFKAASKSGLTRHTKIHTQIRSCNMCEFKTSSKSKLAKHVKIHAHKKLLACQTCSFKTKKISSLTKHMKIHTREAPLTEVKIHTGEKSCTCDSCEFKAALRNNLMRHIKIQI